MSILFALLRRVPWMAWPLLAVSAFAGWQTVHLRWVESSLAVSRSAEQRYVTAQKTNMATIKALQAVNKATIDKLRFIAKRSNALGNEWRAQVIKLQKSKDTLERSLRTLYAKDKKVEAIMQQPVPPSVVRIICRAKACAPS